MRWSKYWSFSFSINPSNEYPGLISFKMDWLELLAVQGTLKSLLQHHSKGHPERFTELHGEEKREEGDRGDQEEKRRNQKRREQASQ